MRRLLNHSAMPAEDFGVRALRTPTLSLSLNVSVTCLLEAAEAGGEMLKWQPSRPTEGLAQQENTGFACARATTNPRRLSGSWISYFLSTASPSVEHATSMRRLLNHSAIEALLIEKGRLKAPVTNAQGGG